MELERIVKKLFDLVPGEYGRYRIERHNNGSYFDVIVVNTEHIGLVIQFSVDKEDGYVWDINVSDLDEYRKFLEFLEEHIDNR